MKKVILSIFLLIIIQLTSFAQKRKPFNYDYEIIYQYTFKPKKADTTKLTEQTVLFCTENDFYYVSVKNYQQGYKIANGGGPQLMAQIMSGQDKASKVTHYVFSRNSVITTLERANNRSFSYDEKVALKWEIQADTTTINGYSCQKATLKYGGRHWAAWFAADIPLSMGPYKFNGLPGLVVKLTEGENEFNWELKSFNKVKTAVPWAYFYNTRNHEPVAKTDFFEYRLKRLLDPYTYDVTLNPKIGKVRSTNPEAIHQAWNKKVKSQLFQDNFIEIE